MAWTSSLYCYLFFSINPILVSSHTNSTMKKSRRLVFLLLLLLNIFFLVVYSEHTGEWFRVYLILTKRNGWLILYKSSLGGAEGESSLRGSSNRGGSTSRSLRGAASHYPRNRYRGGSHNAASGGASCDLLVLLAAAIAAVACVQYWVLAEPETMNIYIYIYK